jgi:hypothetical protein
MPPLETSSGGSNSENEGRASGLATKEALLSTALAYGGFEDQLQQGQQRLRSRSVSPSMAEKTFELAPRSQSRPSSPGFGEDQESKPRRLSVLRSSDSPTAVPLHFRKPPTSPSGTKRISLSSPSPGQSPSSPRANHRRPNSIEFKNVREIRPLWLVERHSSSKFDVEPEGPLPSLPSSKTSSRVPSVENLRESYDENAVADFDFGGGPSYSLGRKPVDLRISTDQLPAEEDDYLNSQQATPTAETYNNQPFGPPPIKKEKPKYEFHSPSELLQDLGAYYDPLVPEPPESMEQLPSVAGSDLGEKEAEKTLEQVHVDPELQPEEPMFAVRDGAESEKKPSAMASFLAGAGFGAVVDAAASAAVDSHDKDKDSSNARELPLTEHAEPEVSTKNVSDQIFEDASTEHAQQQEHVPHLSQPSGNFGDVVDLAVAATASSHDPTTTEEKTDVPKDTQDQVHSSGGIFAGIVDAAVAAEVGKSALAHAEPAKLGTCQDEIALPADNLSQQKAEDTVALTEEPSVEEPQVTVEEPTEDVATPAPSSAKTKKQKKKDRKKKSKSQDLDAPTEDKNDEGETDPAPAVELDSPAQAEGDPAAERPVLTELITETEDQTSPEEPQPAPEFQETKEITEIPIDQPVTDDTKEVAEEVIADAEQPLSTVEPEQTEAVTASAENDTRPSPIAETEPQDTNDQAPHVVAEPEDEGSSANLSKAEKKKLKRNKKKKTLSVSEPAVPETTSADPLDELAGPSTTNEPQPLDQVEKPLPDVASTAMPSEQVENIENVESDPTVLQEQDEQGNKEESDKPIDSFLEPELAEEPSSAAVTGEEDSQLPSGVADGEQQEERSLDNITEEAPAQGQTTEMVTTDDKTEALQDESDKLPETSEVPQQISIEEPIQEDQTLPESEAPVTEEPVDSSAVTTAQPSDDKEEEPTVTPSGKKSKNKKKKKKGKQPSVDEGPSEAPQEFFDTVQAQPESAETAASAEPALAQAEEGIVDEPKEVVDPEPSRTSVDPEVSQSNDVDTQSKEIEEAEDEDLPQELDVLPAETQEEASTKLDDVAIPEDKETPVALVPSDATEPGLESGPLHDELAETTQLVQPDESSVPAPERVEETIEPEKSNDADASIDPVSSEPLPLEQEATSSDKQPLEENEIPESTAKEEEAPITNEDVPEVVSLPPTKKNKKKKGKKNKRDSTVGEPEVTTETGETGLTTPVEPVEPEESATVEERSTEPVEASLTTPAETSTTIPEDSEPSAPADPEATSAEVEVPVEAELELPTATDTIDSPSLVDTEPPTEIEPPTATSVEGPVPESQETQKEQGQSRDLDLAQPEFPNDGTENQDEQSTSQELETSQPNITDKPTEAEPEEVQVADSKKSKKDKRKDKKKKKAAQTLPIDREPSNEPVNEDAPEPVEALPIDEQPSDKPVDQDATEPVEALPTDREPSNEPVNEDSPEPVDVTVPEDPELEGPLPAEQPNLDDQKTEDVNDNGAESQLLEPPREQIQPVDVEERDSLAKETKKSKKKKDKKKKAEAAAAALDKEPSDKLDNDDATEPAEPVYSENPEQAEPISIEQATPDEQQTDNFIEEPQALEISADAPTEAFIEVSTDTPAEEVKSADDSSWSTGLSRSASKKDKKKKKKAMKALLQDEEQSEKPVPEDTEEIVETVAPEEPEQVELTPAEELGPDEQTAANVVEDIGPNDQPQEIPAEPVEEITAESPTEAIAEETLPTDTVENVNSWTQESSKSNKKKDKKKKKTPEPLPLEEEQSEKPVTEDPTELAEVLTPDDLEQSQADEYKTEVKADDFSAESQAQGALEAPVEENTKTVDIPEDDGSTPEPSKGKKKKDKKKKKAAQALSLEEEQPDQPISKDATEFTDSQAPADGLEQSNMDDVKIEFKTEIKTDDNSAETQAPEDLEAPVGEHSKVVDIRGDDGKTQESDNTPEALPSEEGQPEEFPTEKAADLAEAPAAEIAVTEEVLNTEIQTPETPVEEVKPAEVPEDDGWVQETSKSNKKKDKKKKRRSIQIDPAQEESTRNAEADEVKDTPEIATPVESKPAVEDATINTDEQNEAVAADLQPQTILKDDSLASGRPENVEDDSSKAKKSKKKKDKKKKGKNEPLPWDVEPAVEPENQQEAVIEEQAASVDTPEPTANVDSAPDAESAEPEVTAAGQDSEAPKELDSAELIEPVEAIEPTEEVTESTEPPATTEMETPEPTASQSEEPIEVQPSEPVEFEQRVEFQEQVDPTKQDSAMPTDVTAPKSSEDVAEVAEVAEATKDAPLTEPNLAESDEPAANIEREIAEPEKTTDPEVVGVPVENTESLEDSNELSRRPSGKNKKKKKKRGSVQWDEPSPMSIEQQDPLVAPIAVEGTDETTLEDLSRQDKPFELAPTEEVQGEQEIESLEPESADPRDMDAEIQYLSAAPAEPSKPLTAKEKRKEKKKKRNTLDFSISEPDPARADESADVLASAELVMDEQQTRDEAVSDEFAVAGKKKGKKNKRQPVNWEDDIIQAASEDEPKPDDSREPDNAEAVEETSQTPPPTENIDSNPELHETESALQETPVEVDGKETFQSSDETQTDEKEKDFDLTDSMVSPQVQSQTEESLFPVPSPTSDNREDADQPRPSVDYSQIGEPVTTDPLAEDQPSTTEKASAELADQSTVDLQPIDQDLEDADWTTTKSGKGGKKKKSKKNQISFVPDEPLVTEESPVQTPMEIGNRSDFQDQPNVSAEQVEEQPESSPVDQKELPMDNDEDRIQEDQMVISDVQEKGDSKDLVLDDAPPENEPALQEEQPGNDAPTASEPLIRKLSKKDKKKQKKEKKTAVLEEEEPTAVSIEKEYTATISAEQVAETKEENVDTIPAVSEDIPAVNDQPAEEEQILAEPTSSQEEPFARKLSKKEKRKSKKRATEDIVQDDVKDDVQEEKGIEVDSADVEGQLDDVMTPIVTEEPDSGRETATEAATDYAEPESAQVSLDPFDMPDTDGNDPAEFVSPPAADLEGRRQDAEAAMRARALEKEADLDVAASLFEDSPEPERVVSQLSKKEKKAKNSKKTKKASQAKDEKPKQIEAVEVQESRAIETSVREESHDTEPQLFEPDEKKPRSWPSVEFGNDSGEKYDGDKWAVKEDEPEKEHPQISTQDPESMIDDFRAEEVQDQAKDLESDKPAADEARSTSSQSEDVDMAVEAAMAAAGFLSSAAQRTSPGPDISSEIQYPGDSTKTEGLAGVYEQSESLNDTGRSLETADTSFETTRGRSNTNKIANLFPGLERVTYRRPSPKSHEKQASEAITVEERKQPPQFHDKALKITTEVEPAHVPVHKFATPEVETSKDRSSLLLFDSSPSTRLEPTPEFMRRDSSPTIRLQRSSGSLHRTQSIHGHHHTGRAHSWQLEDELTPTKRTSNQSPQALHAEHMGLSPPRTPLDPIKEHEGPHRPSPSPRLVMGEGPYVLERPDSRGSARSSRSLRKANRSISGDLRAAASHDKQIEQEWPQAEHKAGRQEEGWGSQPPLAPHQTEDDDDDLDRHDLENIPSSSTYDPVTDKGKRPVRSMTDVYVS